MPERIWPLPKGTWRINRSFAQHSNKPAAIDFGAPIGTPVLAAQAGVVETVANLNDSYGSHVFLRHPGGFRSIYAHMILGSITVRQGQTVTAGERLGKLGATGNADGAHLHFEVRNPSGTAIDPAVWLSGAGTATGPSGTGSKDPQPSEPLPEPPKRKPGSGRSRPHFGDDTWTLSGGSLNRADLEGLVTASGLDMSVEEVAQVSLTVTDPGLTLVRRDYTGAVLGWDGTAWDLSAVDVSAAAGQVNLAGRSVLARRMRRTYRVVGEHKVRPDQWIDRWAAALGGTAVVEPTSRRAVVPDSTDQSVWDVLGALCSDLGWSFVEIAGVVYAGSRIWAYDGGPGLPLWPVTWKTDPATDLLDVQASLTHDDPDLRGSADLVLRWNQGRRIRPWHRLTLSGLGIYDGTWLVETLQTPNDGTSTVAVSAIRPRRKTKESNQPTDTAPPKDKKSPAYAKWYARKRLASYGWGQDQWAPLEKLWTRESGWRWDAKNPTSGAYGIPQSLPAEKMASAGADWKTNPETQIRWGLGYIKGRYRAPERAWAHSEKEGWY